MAKSIAYTKQFIKEYNKLVERQNRLRAKEEALKVLRKRGLVPREKTEYQLEKEKYTKKRKRLKLQLRMGIKEAPQAPTITQAIKAAERKKKERSYLAKMQFAESRTGRFLSARQRFISLLKVGGYSDPFSSGGKKAAYVSGSFSSFLGFGGTTQRQRVSLGRGRPSGPSGKYVIPGVGPVGVYEYRMWLRQQLRERRMALQRQNQLSPAQKAALMSLAERQRARAMNPENRVIPDTDGSVPTKSIHQEIDDYANEIP